MRTRSWWRFAAASAVGTVSASAETPITWLARFEAGQDPGKQGWSAVGDLAARARPIDGALRIADDSISQQGAFRAGWRPEPGQEVIVEARIRVEAVPGTAKVHHSTGPGSDGAGVGLLVSDGTHADGIALLPDRVATFYDRMAMLPKKPAFHDYRLVIRGRDMSVAVDGTVVIHGENAFTHAAPPGSAFIQFGSNSDHLTGVSEWAWVRLGIRPASEPATAPRLKITVSEPWDILTPDHPRSTRPFVHDVGGGLLMMSVAQGPDAYFEPYGVMVSRDRGRTWTGLTGLQEKTFAPQAFLRRPDGQILGVSRWNVKYAQHDGSYVGMSFRFDPAAKTWSMFENSITMPAGMGLSVPFNRDIFDLGGGSIVASVYGPTAEGGRRSYLLESRDEGASWHYWSTLGATAEPAVTRIGGHEMTAVLRTNSWQPFLQIWSHDDGKTWTQPVKMEEGSVDPDLTQMSNGVLACSYGRPDSNLMFSLDGGHHWEAHCTISDEAGFNYTAIREVSPGRLLYVHDAPHLRAVYVDVQRLDGR